MALSKITTNSITDDAVTNAKVADDAVNTAQIADNAVANAQMADNAVSTSEIADDAVTTAKLGLTFSNGTGTQDGTSNNTTYDIVTGLTIPAKALIIVSYNFAAKSGENGNPGSNATIFAGLTDSSNALVDTTTRVMRNENPKVGYRDCSGGFSYFNDTSSALTSHKIRVQQYDDGAFNSSLITVNYKIIGFD